MKGLVMISNGKAFVMSHEVAEKFSKEHRTIYRKVEDLIKSQPDFGAANFGVTSYVTNQNKTHACFTMTRDGFCVIAMSLTGREAEKWKIKYIEAFNAMEEALLSDINKTSSVMDQLNEAYKKMNDDKEKTSMFGTGLSEWKRVRKSHIESVGKLQDNVQILLNFKFKE